MRTNPPDPALSPLLERVAAHLPDRALDLFAAAYDVVVECTAPLAALASSKPDTRRAHRP
jgi:hypothetical protein